ncbi:MAG: UMP kinase [Thermoplasmatota archaeon]|jgi:uridylate kinase
MESIVISLGGSVILSEEITTSYFKNLTTLLKELAKDYKIYLVIGGGKTARTYIKLGRELDLDEETLDQIGIEITRLNAKLIANIINISNKYIPRTTDEAINIKKPIVVMGGTTPSHSTDMVGAELAEKIKASKYIIATNVDGVYDKDPNKFKDAVQLKEISIKQLIEKYGTKWESAGQNIVIDGPALEIINRAQIPTFVLNGKKLEELKKAIKNQKFNGTIIKK